MSNTPEASAVSPQQRKADQNSERQPALQNRCGDPRRFGENAVLHHAQ
jgi:hypothetical protein